MINVLRTAGSLARRWRPGTPTLMVAGAALALHAGAPRAADVPSDEELVRDHYPSDLASESSQLAQAGGMARPGHAFVPATFPGVTSGDLVAAYDNGFGGAVRVLRRNGQQVQIVDAPRFPAMGGTDSGVTLVDLEADGVPEIVASFGAPAGGVSAWMFRWTNTGLVFLGPSTTDETGAVVSMLHAVSFRDLDGDGTMEAVDSGTDDQGTPVVRIFKLMNGGFTLWKEPIYYAELGRDGLRSTLIDTTVQGPAGLRTMWIMNGRAGQIDTRLRSAVISWNGATLVPASEFGTDVGSLHVPVVLTGTEDALQIELRGSLDGEMAILIE
jgi:hypothetical protein